VESKVSTTTAPAPEPAPAPATTTKITTITHITKTITEQQKGINL